MSETEKPKDDKPQEKDDEKWSKEKQRADQAEASSRLKVQENEQLTAQLSEAGDNMAKLEQKLADLAESQDVPVEDLLDPDLVDAKTIKTVSKLAKQNRDMQKKIDKLTKLADDFQSKEQTKKAKSEKDKTIDEILKVCDEEFGAKFRNSAKKMADALVDDGKEPQPKTIMAAYRLMRKCYAEVKAKAEKKETEKKKPVQTDSGVSSFSLDASVPKKGTLKEVMAGIRKTGLGSFGRKT